MVDKDDYQNVTETNEIEYDQEMPQYRTPQTSLTAPRGRDTECKQPRDNKKTIKAICCVINLRQAHHDVLLQSCYIVYTYTASIAQLVGHPLKFGAGGRGLWVRIPWSHHIKGVKMVLVAHLLMFA